MVARGVAALVGAVTATAFAIASPASASSAAVKVPVGSGAGITVVHVTAKADRGRKPSVRLARGSRVGAGMRVLSSVERTGGRVRIRVAVIRAKRSGARRSASAALRLRLVNARAPRVTRRSLAIQPSGDIKISGAGTACSQDARRRAQQVRQLGGSSIGGSPATAFALAVRSVCIRNAADADPAVAGLLTTLGAKVPAPERSEPGRAPAPEGNRAPAPEPDPSGLPSGASPAPAPAPSPAPAPKPQPAPKPDPTPSPRAKVTISGEGELGPIALTESIESEFVIANEGGGTTGRLKVSVNGSPELSLVATSCNGKPLPPKATCMATVRFRADELPDAIGTLVVSELPDEHVLTAKPLRGRALAPPQALLAIDPPHHDFHDVAIGADAEQMFTVHNQSDQAAQLGDVQLAGSPDFHIAENSCGETLPPFEDCVVLVRFAPTSPGEATGSLTIVSSNAEPVSASLTGIGRTEATLAPDGFGGQVNFGTKPSNTMSYLPLTLKNAGEMPINDVAVEVLDNTFGVFGILETSCTGTLAPGDMCKVTPSFGPGEPGTHSAAIRVFGYSSSAALVELVVPLTGQLLAQE